MIDIITMLYYIGIGFSIFLNGILLLIVIALVFLNRDSKGDHDNDNGDGGIKHNPTYPKGGDATYSKEILEKLV